MEDRSGLVPSREAFECPQNLTMVHQTAALHIDEGQGNQPRLIDDISCGGGHNFTSPWVTVCVVDFWAIRCFSNGVRKGDKLKQCDRSGCPT